MAEQRAIFTPQRIYLKDASFEAPGAPGVFLQVWRPDINLQMDNTARAIDGEPDVYEAQLKVNIEAKLEGKSAYIVEVVQCGVFTIAGFPEPDKLRLTGAVCPEILYSYAREAVSNLIVKGGFPAFLLNPINFNYLYEQRLQKAQAGGDVGAGGVAQAADEAPKSQAAGE